MHCFYSFGKSWEVSVLNFVCSSSSLVKRKKNIGFMSFAKTKLPS